MLLTGPIEAGRNGERGFIRSRQNQCPLSRTARIPPQTTTWSRFSRQRPTMISRKGQEADVSNVVHSGGATSSFSRSREKETALRSVATDRQETRLFKELWSGQRQATEVQHRPHFDLRGTRLTQTGSRASGLCPSRRGAARYSSNCAQKGDNITDAASFAARINACNCIRHHTPFVLAPRGLATPPKRGVRFVVGLMIGSTCPTRMIPVPGKPRVLPSRSIQHTLYTVRQPRTVWASAAHKETAAVRNSPTPFGPDPSQRAKVSQSSTANSYLTAVVRICKSLHLSRIEACVLRPGPASQSLSRTQSDGFIGAQRCTTPCSTIDQYPSRLARQFGPRRAQ